MQRLHVCHTWRDSKWKWILNWNWLVLLNTYFMCESDVHNNTPTQNQWTHWINVFLCPSRTTEMASTVSGYMGQWVNGTMTVTRDPFKIGEPFDRWPTDLLPVLNYASTFSGDSCREKLRSASQYIISRSLAYWLYNWVKHTGHCRPIVSFGNVHRLQFPVL